ncbi:M14 family zinc carboxypeptidase [Paracoccus denitrificans]|uniref:M14 family zinc carboxypeptidase n=1 Tax=Paracoccus denitrificans TaxID=266 RepID=UPI000CEBF1B4|nr:M14 family zinc carboxypeptidase [Paracoccus denitrificans]
MGGGELLFQADYPATLDRLCRDLTCARAEIWSFDDAPTRRAAEQALAARGVRARCRSAYKPLLHAFLEEIQTEGLAVAEIACPRHPQAVPGRFLLEAYPLPALFPLTDFRFSEGRESEAMPVYRLRLGYASGEVRHATVPAPNRPHRDHAGGMALSPCGWLIRDGLAEALETDYEALFHDTMRAIAAAPWSGEPCFQELNIAVTLPVRDQSLDWGAEAVSLAEALHEDLYFSLIEHFQCRFGRPSGDRSLRLGQIVPEIRHGPRHAVRVRVRDWDRSPAGGARWQRLDRAHAPLAPAQIARELARLPGVPFAARSVAGRPVEARYLPGRDRAVMISAGQHANEVSGPVGALRAAQELARREGAHFTLCPLENPDGYALRQRLAGAAPRHMLHAARYTALGDDLEHRHEPPEAERGIRDQALRLSGALLHVSLHGYPAHEWTRPLSGYVPRGFRDWTLPRGFFLILRHHPGWARPAALLAEAVIARLARLPDLVAFNTAQLALARRHGVVPQAPGGFVRIIVEDARPPVPLVLVTEYPDETLLGAPFAAAHEAQRSAVIAAYDAFQELDLGDRPVA